MTSYTAFDRDLWAEERKRWGVPVALVVLGLLLLVVYQVRFSGRVDVLDSQRAREEERLADLLAEREQVAARLERASGNREGIQYLYDEVFETERQRLTAVIREVKDLASRAGLEPPGITYPEEAIEDHELLRKSFVFSVKGQYEELRRFINFIELSEHFLILEEIRVSDTTEGSLSVALRISTLFENSGYQESRAAAGGGR